MEKENNTREWTIKRWSTEQLESEIRLALGDEVYEKMKRTP